MLDHRGSTFSLAVSGVDSPTMILGNSLNTLKAAPQATPCFLTLPLGMNMSNAGVIPVTTGLSVQPSIHHVPVQEVSLVVLFELIFLVASSKYKIRSLSA